MWNRLKTAILLAMLSGLLMLLGSFVGGQQGVLIAFIIALAVNALSYFFSDKLVLALYKAQPLDREHYEKIYTIVDELSSKMHLPMPKLWIIQTPMANAFATGRGPNHASIALTTGIVGVLEPHELRGVLAHELAHVKNRDILISTIAATIAATIGYLAHMIQHMVFWQSIGSDRRSRSGNPIVLIIIALLMPIAAMLIQLAVSRSREYLADETAAYTSEDPLALASALEKLEKHVAYAHLESNNSAYAGTAPLFIVHPFLKEGLITLFSTHPSTKNRVERLHKTYEKIIHW